MHSGLYLDVDHAGTANRTNVIQFGLTGDPNQRWKIYPMDNGYCVIRPSHASGLALDVLDSGTTSNVGIWNVGSSNDSSSVPVSSQWKLFHSSNGGTVIKSRCSNETMALEVYQASMASEANVTQYYYTDDEFRNDEWILEPIYAFTGNNTTTWSLSSQAVTPTGTQEFMYVPQRGILWLDFYNSSNQKALKSTVDFWFTQSNINEVIRRSKFALNPEYFDFDVTSH